MKKYVLIFFACVLYTSSYAQVSFQERIISTNANAAWRVFSIDIDGDDDLDVLSASADDDKIAWYENTNGLGDFGAEIIITTDADQATSVYAGDIDGDGDIDVLSSSFTDGKIAWYENTDGLGDFGAQQVITQNPNQVVKVFAVDLDGDGDIDVLSANYNKIAWYENTDGLGTFSAELIITTNVNGSGFSVYAEDIDNDGDIDVLSASYSDDKIAWYENTDGLGNFGAQQIITTNADSARDVYCADLDGDGDMDVISASADDDKIAWYENTDGLGNFGAEQVLSTTADFAASVYAADLDNDGDMDVISASAGDDKIAWYENLDGLGNFSDEQIIATNANFVLTIHVADLDGDGDMDVLSASQFDDKIAWQENLLILLGAEENDFLDVVVYPNPTGGILIINNQTIVSQIEIYNVLGELVISKIKQNNVDMSSLSNGIYLVKIVDDKGNLAIKKVVKK